MKQALATPAPERRRVDYARTPAGSPGTAGAPASFRSRGCGLAQSALRRSWRSSPRLNVAAIAGRKAECLVEAEITACRVSGEFASKRLRSWFALCNQEQKR
jgi:hypothetical protein